MLNLLLNPVFPSKLKVSTPTPLHSHSYIGPRPTFTPSLIQKTTTTQELVESPTILKLGVNIVQDYAKLIKDFGISPRMGVELRDIVNVADRPSMAAHGIPEHERRVKFSLLVRIFMHKELDKGPVKIGNWEKYPLSETQIDCTSWSPRPGIGNDGIKYVVYRCS